MRNTICLILSVVFLQGCGMRDSPPKAKFKPGDRVLVTIRQFDYPMEKVSYPAIVWERQLDHENKHGLFWRYKLETVNREAKRMEEVDIPEHFLKRLPPESIAAGHVDGKLHGRYFETFGGGSTEGRFDRGVPVGLWKDRYPNGELRRETLFTGVLAETNRPGGPAGSSRILHQKDYRPDGTVAGSITDGRGVSVTMRDDGRGVRRLRTTGYPLDCRIILFPKGFYSEQPFANIKIGHSQGPNGFRTLFRCGITSSGKIVYVVEYDPFSAWVREDIRKKCPLLPESTEAPPPFLLGKARRVIPSLIDGRPVFDTEISCSNGRLVVRKVKPGTGR